MYCVYEIITDGDTTTSTTRKKTTRAEAMSTYYSIMAAAEVSSHEYHTALVVDKEGKYIARESCYHPAEPEAVSEE